MVWVNGKDTSQTAAQEHKFAALRPRNVVRTRRRRSHGRRTAGDCVDQTNPDRIFRTDFYKIFVVTSRTSKASLASASTQLKFRCRVARYPNIWSRPTIDFRPSAIELS